MANLIKNLKEPHRSVVIFKYYEDLRISDIAKIMDCSEGTIKSRLHTAKAMLRKQLDLSRKGEILMSAFTMLPMTAAIDVLAQNTVLDSSVAFEILSSTVGAGVAATLAFAPQAAAGAASSATSTVVTAGTAGGGAIAVTAGTIAAVTMFAAPNIVDLSINNKPDQFYTNEHAIVSVEIDGSFSEISNLIAKEDGGEPIYPYEHENSMVKFAITENGNYTIYLENDKGKIQTREFVIDFMDVNSPSISSYSLDGDIINITLEDDLSGVNMENIYGIDTNANKIYPTSIKGNSVQFKTDLSEFILYVYDKVNNLSTFNIEKY